MKQIISLLFLLLSLQCTPSTEYSTREREVNRTRKQVNILMRMKYGLHAVGVGGSATTEAKQRLISTVYEIRSKEPKSKACMRAMVIDAANTLLKQVNQAEDLQPYLETIPYPLTGIEVAILQRHPSLDRVHDPYPTWAEVRGGKVIFIYHSPDQNSSAKEETETWEEAVEKVRAEPCEGG